LKDWSDWDVFDDEDDEPEPETNDDPQPEPADTSEEAEPTEDEWGFEEQ